MQKTNVWAACLLMLLASIGLFWLIPNNSKPVQNSMDIAPSFMPSLALGIIAVMALVLAFQSFGRAQKQAAKEEQEDEVSLDEATGIGRQEFKNIITWIGFSVLSLCGLHFLGFYIAAPLMLASAMVYAKCRNPVLIGVISIAFPLLLGQVVWYAFSISMP